MFEELFYTQLSVLFLGTSFFPACIRYLYLFSLNSTTVKSLSIITSVSLDPDPYGLSCVFSHHSFIISVLVNTSALTEN